MNAVPPITAQRQQTLLAAPSLEGPLAAWTLAPDDPSPLANKSLLHVSRIHREGPATMCSAHWWRAEAGTHRGAPVIQPVDSVVQPSDKTMRPVKEWTHFEKEVASARDTLRQVGKELVNDHRELHEKRRERTDQKALADDTSFDASLAAVQKLRWKIQDQARENAQRREQIRKDAAKQAHKERCQRLEEWRKEGNLPRENRRDDAEETSEQVVVQKSMKPSKESIAAQEARLRAEKLKKKLLRPLTERQGSCPAPKGQTK
eukprot:gnl/MRDRNA2_/MRDRNA2_90653_c0_seq1.p1 gnl/MRDRNA2_/MRDRNA2_90653_c0~~gnl/MRDRNA2_/MRDRNA2_90653_c0_seq1.p1  ORF type:complete len:273 (+),score=79.96 gnl/MRDRNA2_/MRDRNA2_90653_c0_seq1:38-820(+)